MSALRDRGPTEVRACALALTKGRLVATRIERDAVVVGIGGGDPCPACSTDRFPIHDCLETYLPQSRLARMSLLELFKAWQGWRREVPR